jgi:hypothetical protein
LEEPPCHPKERSDEGTERRRRREFANDADAVVETA